MSTASRCNSRNRRHYPFLGFGVGLRTQHYPYILEHWPQVDWFEVISENYMVPGGRPLYVLDQIRERYPVVMHGVSLSIGSTDPLDKDYLASLKKLGHRVQPRWISDHLCWTGVGGHNAHDLLPLPYTEEAVRHVVRRVGRVQETLGCRILLENVSSYMSFKDSVMSEWEFLTRIVEEADCDILLDINNIFVSSFNHGFDPEDYLDGVPVNRVVQFHMAGHSDKGDYLLDTHDHPIRKEVWGLYAKAVERFGAVSTLIEWDDRIPAFPVLQRLADRCRTIFQKINEKTAYTPAMDSTSPLEAHYGP